ncbi:MAG TPA: hypothetical protein VHY33_05840, partial [Thermoanaerobaculia bacterium]|nr:hypothetical protein [Thermoanaerobaculia bacterium]
FIGEFLILAGSFQTHPRWTIVAATSVILAAIYLLWLIQRVFFGPITNDENRKVREIAWNEIAALVPLVILMVWIGVCPNTFLRKMTPSVQQLLAITRKTDAGRAVIAGQQGRGTRDEGLPIPRSLSAASTLPGKRSPSSLIAATTVPRPSSLVPVSGGVR